MGIDRILGSFLLIPFYWFLIPYFRLLTFLFMKRVLILLLLGVSYFQASGQGNGWEWQNPLPTGMQLNDVHVFDAQTALAIGASGIILKTSDGGITWQSQTSGTAQIGVRRPLYNPK